MKEFSYSISDSLTIHELRSSNGLTAWFGQDLTQEVCLTGLCKQVHLWIFWDSRGDFLGFEIFEDEPLTKIDHEPFEQADYQKLNQVLKDDNSIFQYLSYEDLEVRNDKIDSSIDGVSGATNPDLNAYTVEGAIYTFYSLWHAVHGPIKKGVKSIAFNRNDTEYLSLLMDLDTMDYQSIERLSIELANRQWAKANKYINWAKNEGLNINWYSFLLNPLSTSEKYAYGFWLSFYLFYDLEYIYKNQDDNKKMNALLKSVYN